MPQNIVEFSVTTDLKQLDSLGDCLPAELPIRVPLLFSRLHPFFDAGVLFKKQDLSWCPQSAFQKGFYFELSPRETKFEFTFPELTLTQVIRAKSSEVIADLGLEESLVHDKVTALVFRPHPDYLFLILSELADPWLKLQIDKTQTKTLMLLSDYL